MKKKFISSFILSGLLISTTASMFGMEQEAKAENNTWTYRLLRGAWRRTPQRFQAKVKAAALDAGIEEGAEKIGKWVPSFLKGSTAERFAFAAVLLGGSFLAFKPLLTKAGGPKKVFFWLVSSACKLFGIDSLAINGEDVTQHAREEGKQVNSEIKATIAEKFGVKAKNKDARPKTLAERVDLMARYNEAAIQDELKKLKVQELEDIRKYIFEKGLDQNEGYCVIYQEAKKLLPNVGKQETDEKENKPTLDNEAELAANFAELKKLNESALSGELQKYSSETLAQLAIYMQQQGLHETNALMYNKILSLKDARGTGKQPKRNLLDRFAGLFA